MSPSLQFAAPFAIAEQLGWPGSTPAQLSQQPNASRIRDLDDVFNGALAEVTEAVRDLTGHDPRTFEEFLAGLPPRAETVGR